jgi:hypothetical protein
MNSPARLRKLTQAQCEHHTWTFAARMHLHPSRARFCPTGKSVARFSRNPKVQPFSQKVFAFAVGQNISRDSRVSCSDRRGAYRDRHDTLGAGRDGCGWRQARFLVAPDENAFRIRRSRVVLMSRRWHQVLEKQRFSGMTVTTKPDHRGEHEGNRKTFARGRPGCSAVPVVTCWCASSSCAPGCGCGFAPGFPCALCC